jgi:hypothetical protein
MPEKIKLILCANKRQMKGFKHHDVIPLEGIDYVCDLFDIKKYVAEDSCEDIHFTHALEHFPTAKIQEVLALVKSILAPRGKLYIEVPNFEWHAELVRLGKEKDAVMYAFGGQENEWDFHKTGFTPNILHEDLTKAGFTNIKLRIGSSISGWANK